MVDKLVHYLYNSDYEDTGYCPEDEKEGKEKGTTPRVGKEAGQDGKDNAEVGADKDDEKEDRSEVKHESPQQKESQLLALNAGMYIIGDRFDLSQLKDLAKEKFSAALIGRWDKEQLPDVIRTIYEYTLPSDRGLRDCLVPTLVKHKKALRGDESFMKLVKTHGDFAVDLIDAWVGAFKG
ncbi:MAG: hypothetical protein Q9208_003690 [Pyrenodesmia sp. 3 TL-2023]